MKTTRFQKATLGIAGVTALGIGGFIALAPQEFYASYGITIGSDANLRSELRAPGAGLAAFGALMLAGLFHRTLSLPAQISALIIYLAFPAGRVIGLLADGVPSAGIIAALVFELALAALCLVAFWPRLRTEAHPAPQA